MQIKKGKGIKMLSKANKEKKHNRKKGPRTGLTHTYENFKQKLKDGYTTLEKKTRKSIRLEILWMVGISFIVSSLTFFCVSRVLHTTTGEYSYTSYKESRQSVDERFLNTVKRLNALQGDLGEYINLPELYSIIQEDENLVIAGLQNYLTKITDGKLAFDQFTTSQEEIQNQTSPQEEGSAQQAPAQSTTSVMQLYRQLSKLQQTEQWNDQTVTSIIINFLEQNNISTQSIILSAAQEIAEDLKDSMNSYSEKADIYLVDSTGQLIYSDGYIEKLDLVKIIQSVNDNDNEEGSTYKAIYPVIINGQVYYIFAEATLEQQTYYGHNEDLGNILGFIAAVGVFILLVTRLTKDKIAYIEYLSNCLNEISKGDLSYKVDMIGEDELAQVAHNITTMEHEIQTQIQAQIRAEKVKNELVTNVAHDLRTPLTSIIGYIGLVKDKRYDTEEEHDKYLNIAYDKSEKLKVIIEDLFELTKLHQDSVQLNKEIISINNLLNQLVEELMPLANEKNIEVQTYIEPTAAEVAVDVAKITRVFENLIENAIKYSEPGNAIYIELKEFSKQVYVAVSNHCDNIPQEEVEKFFERFYRADKSRNSQAGGSGLGLAIAKNIVELHGGKINAKVNGDLISFKVGLPKYK